MNHPAEKILPSADVCSALVSHQCVCGTERRKGICASYCMCIFLAAVSLSGCALNGKQQIVEFEFNERS